MTALWTADEAARATDGTAHGAWQVGGVSIDTRTIQPGDLFVALTDSRDGHDFVAQALEKGAGAALVTHRPDGVSEDAPLLIVADVLAALAALGRAARARSDAKIVAITGSVGKTSTKEMLRIALGAQGRTHAAEASYNNHWGVPLTLARMPQNTEYAVIEIGMNAPFEIGPLSEMTRPDVAMITNIAPAHLAAFENIDGIATEKSQIVKGLRAGLPVILNADTPGFALLRDAADLQAAKTITFGTFDTDWRLDDVRLSPDATVIKAAGGSQDYLIKLSVPGRHFAMNAVAVLAAVDALGADAAQASRDLAAWIPPAGRGTREVVQIDQADDAGTIDLIDDAFNANPASMSAAFEILAASMPRDGIGRINKGRRIAVLGDMLELGVDELLMHAALANDTYLQQADQVYCVGPLMKALQTALPHEQQGGHFASPDDLRGKIAHHLDAGDVVLVKGSKGSRVSLIVDAIRKLGHR